MHRLFLSLTVVALLAARAFGYGSDGHEAVGAIADARLKGKPAAQKVDQLLDGLTLQEAATIPDRIKSWDSNKPFKLGTHHRLETELRDFWSANLDKVPGGQKMHHVFHYTDVSIAEKNPKYVDGAIGTGPYDVVHMIPFCIKVLTGDIPEENERKITKSVAVILLAHYLGDIHQPLHVGAAYFDKDNQLVTPSRNIQYREDIGGNDVLLTIIMKDEEKQVGNLHHFWDSTAVVKAFGITKEKPFQPTMIQSLLTTEPENWKPADDSKPVDWAKNWADEILPIAREAHMRLTFHEGAEGDKIKATVKDTDGYEDWAAKTVKDEIQKGGYRLAYLLEKIH